MPARRPARKPAPLLYAVWRLDHQGREEFVRYVLPREARATRGLTGVSVRPVQPDQMVLL
jgi:hypothetical protein